MHDLAQSALGPFALYVLKPVWIESVPTSADDTQVIVWRGQGPSGVPVLARKDGFVFFLFDQSPAYSGGDVPSYVPEPSKRIPERIKQAQEARVDLLYRRLEYMNAFLAGFYSAWSTVAKTGTYVQAPIDPESYFLGFVLEGIYRPAGDSLRKIDAPTSRPVIQAEMVAHAVAAMNACDNRFGQISISLLNLTYLACHQYRLHQLSSAHLIAWSVCEMQLNAIWNDIVSELDVKNGGHTKINRERRDQLTGRDFTASIVTQMASLHNKIDDELLVALDAARRKRNAFAHSLESVAAEDAGKAIRAATDLMTKLTGFRITSQLSLAYNL